MWNKFQFSDSDHPARPRVARFERKTKREAAGTTTIPIDARQNANHASGFSRFSWSADSREQDKTRWKREREVICVRRTRYHGTSVAHTLWPPCLVIVSRCKISRSIYAPLPATGRKLAVGPRRLSRLIHLA